MAKLLTRFGDKLEGLSLDKSKRREREPETAPAKAEETVPLHVAVKQGVDIVSALVNKGVNPNVRDADGNTPLMVAVESDMVPVVSYLSSFAHVDLDVQNNKGETALHITVKSGKVAMTEQLKRLGANKEIADSSGKTPSHLVLDIADRDMQVAMMTALNTPVSMQPRTEIANRRRSKAEQRKSLFRSDSMDTLEATMAGYRDDRKRRKKKQDGDNISIKSSFAGRIGGGSKSTEDFDTQSVCSSKSEWDGVSLVSYDPSTKKPKWKKGIEKIGEKAVDRFDRFSDKFRSSLRIKDKAESLQFGGDFADQPGTPPTIAVEEDQTSIGSRSMLGFGSPRGSPALKRSPSTRSKMAPAMVPLDSIVAPRFRLQVVHGVRHMVLQCEPTDTIEQIIEATQRLAGVEVKGVKEAWATTVYGEKLNNHIPVKDQKIQLDDIVLIDSFSTFP